MKKILSLLLVLPMLLCTVSCGSMRRVKLEAGYARVSITPDYEVGPDGQMTLLEPININSTTIATSVYNEICATAIAITDGKTELVLISTDLREIPTSTYEVIVEEIEKETGVPKNNILLSATHNHAAPEMSNLQNEQLTAYKGFLAERIPQAVKLALEDLDPVTMHIGRAETPGMNFVRRYIMSDGSLGSISGTKEGTTYVSHESNADTEFQTLKLDRKEKKDIVLSNWQCHPAAMYPKNTINADWVHIMREGVEKNHDALFAFFNGGFGNVNQLSWIPGEMVYGTSPADKQTTANVGNALVEIVGKTLEEMQPIQSGRILIKNDYAPLTREWANLFVAAIGDFALTGNPFEMFHQHGEYVKDNSPYEMTFFIGLSNGAEGYMPTAEAYTRGGYEKDFCRYHPETGDESVKLLVDILKEFKESETAEKQG